MLTQTKLKELLHYNPKTWIWTRKISRGGKPKGCKAGSINSLGYRQIGIDGKNYKSYRLAWLYMCGYFPEHDIDHINRIRDDDRWENIRHVSRSCNMHNYGNRADNKSGVKGIYWYKAYNKWHSMVRFSGKGYSLGYYSDFDDAVCARLAAEQCLGWSGCDSNSPAFQYVQRMMKNLEKGWEKRKDDKQPLP